MTGRRWTTRLAATAAGLLSGLAAVVACSGPDTSAPTLADIRAVLAQHGAAVIHHDARAFLAGVDPAAAAIDFRAEQQQEYANLTKLPLARWSYSLGDRTDDHSAERAAGRRLGANAVIVRVTLAYAVRSYDRVPVTRELWWTFVRHDGRVVVAADDSLAPVGGASWHGPWDFGPLDVVAGRTSLVLGHADNAPLLAGIAGDTDAAIPAVSAVWGTDWARRVLVVVPSSPSELTALVGDESSVTADVAAAAINAGTDPMTGAAVGERLIVNPDALQRLSPTGTQILFRHEITHIASAGATTGATPRWLIEGLADYVANLHSGQPVTTVAAELRADVRAGRVPTALPASAAFDTAGESAQAYEGAWLACRLIAARIGSEGLVHFYIAVGRNPGDSDQALAAALRSTLHETTARFTAQWRAYLRSELG